MEAMLNIVLDAAIVLIVLIAAVCGAKRGFVMTLAGLVTYILALVGSMLITGLLAPSVSGAMLPSIEEKVLPEIGEIGNALDIGDMEVFGVCVGDFEAYGDISNATDGAVTAAGHAISVAIADSVARCVISVVSFVMIVVALKIVAHAVDLAAKLPVLSTLNGLLGLIVGVAVGTLLVFVIVSVISLFTGLVPKEVADSTTLFKFLRDVNPITFITTGGSKA